MTKKLLSMSYGPLYLEFDAADNLLITRSDSGMAIVLSSSEWNFILKAIELHGWPTSPPINPLIGYHLTVDFLKRVISPPNEDTLQQIQFEKEYERNGQDEALQREQLPHVLPTDTGGT